MISHYIRLILSTFHDPVFYGRIRDEDLAQAVKATVFVLTTLVLVVVLFVAVACIPYVPKLPTYLGQIENLFPSDLVITAANGHVSINQPEPYSIPNPLGNSKYFIVFDSTGKTSEDLSVSSTTILVKDTYMVMADKNNSSRIVSFSDIGATSTYNRVQFNAFVEQFRPYVVPFALIGGILSALVIGFFAVVFWTVFHLLYVFFPAVLLYGYSALRGVKTGMRRMYIIALYASLPVAIITFFSDYYVGLPVFVYTGLVLFIAGINMSRIPVSATPPLPPDIQK